METQTFLQPDDFTDLHFQFSSIDLYIHFLVKWPYGIFSVYLFNNKKNQQMKLSSLTDMEADVFECFWSVRGRDPDETLLPDFP